MYLHQGLYAKLLQLHLKLDYLPSVLLVPISSDNDSDVRPGLFFLLSRRVQGVDK